MNQILIRLIRQRWPLALNGVLLFLFCWLLAQWTWLLVLPKAHPTDQVAALLPKQDYAGGIASLHMFGRSAESAPVAAAVASTSNIKLYGVFAATGTLPAFAILSLDGRPGQPVQSGKEITSGVILQEVHPDYVLLKKQGMTERLNLEKRLAASAGTTGPAEFKLNVQAKGGDSFSFSRAELNKALQDSKQLAFLGRLSPYPAGGMLVEEVPSGSLVAKLGLQVGDVVQRLNFQPVRSQEDIQRFLKQLEHLPQARLDGIRAGRPIQLKYEIQQ